MLWACPEGKRAPGMNNTLMPNSTIATAKSMMVINSVFTIGVLFNRKDMKPPRNIGDDATYFNQELPK